MQPEVVAVVPVFNPGPGLPHKLMQLLAQVSLVVVVDDGSESFVEVGSIADVIVVRQENSGIAAALNAGIRRAQHERPNLSHILTVDQDSELGELYVEASLETLHEGTTAGLDVAATAAAKHNGVLAQVLERKGSFEAALKVAQSGMLFPAKQLERVGLFDDSLVIDVVETDWCLRARAVGALVLLAPGTDMRHPVGDPRPIRFGRRPLRWRGRERSYSYHSPLRRYYITRNRLLVYPRYVSSSGAWIGRDTVAEMRTVIISLALSDGRWALLLAIVAGIRDGLRGHRGKAPLSLQRALAVRQ